MQGMQIPSMTPGTKISTCFRATKLTGCNLRSQLPPSRGPRVLSSHVATTEEPLYPKLEREIACLRKDPTCCMQPRPDSAKNEQKHKVFLNVSRISMKMRTVESHTVITERWTHSYQVLADHVASKEWKGSNNIINNVYLIHF